MVPDSSQSTWVTCPACQNNPKQKQGCPFCDRTGMVPASFAPNVIQALKPPEPDLYYGRTIDYRAAEKTAKALLKAARQDATVVSWTQGHIAHVHRRREPKGHSG